MIAIPREPRVAFGVSRLYNTLIVLRNCAASLPIDLEFIVDARAACLPSFISMHFGKVTVERCFWLVLLELKGLPSVTQKLHRFCVNVGIELISVDMLEAWGGMEEVMDPYPPFCELQLS